MAERDFLDKMIDKRTARNPEFPRLLDAARRRRELLHALGARREDQQRGEDDGSGHRTWLRLLYGLCQGSVPPTGPPPCGGAGVRERPCTSCQGPSRTCASYA